MSTDINHENELKMREEYSESILNNVATVIGYTKHITWSTVKILINNEPKPSQRPRLSGYRVYVPGAYKNAAFFQKHVLPTLGDLFIETPCKMQIDIYAKTPTSFSKSQKLLAEMKILRPWTHTGDVDNYAKSAMDQIQPNKKRGHRGILSDDALVFSMSCDKYYSTTPRYELTITYMNNIPECIRKIMKLIPKE